MNETTITCPTCSHAHEMYWYVHGSGKKQLAYTCNNKTTKKVVFKTVNGLPGEELRRSTKRVLIKPFDQEFVDVNPTREVWSTKWRNKMQEQNQLKLPENISPGQDLELLTIDSQIADWLEAKKEAQGKFNVAASLLDEAETRLAELGRKRSEIVTPKML